MILYHNSMSTCAQKVRFVLEAKGLEWKSEHLNLRNGDQHTEEYLKLNPIGVVPTLIHDRAVITESAIICEYLDDQFPFPKMRPEKPIQLAEMRHWIKLIDGSIHAHAGVVSNAIAFRFQKLAKGHAAAKALVEGIPDEKKRERMRSIVFEGIESPIFEDSLHAFAAFLSKMESSLQRTPFLAGDALSIADVVCLPYIIRLEQLCMSGLWHELPMITIWLHDIKKTKTFKRAFGDWEDPKYLEIMKTKGTEYWPQIELHFIELN